MNAVWLASWYPNRTSITNGDFIERHAKAVAPLLDSLTIITAVKDRSLAHNSVEIVEKSEGNLTTYIIYYGRSRWGGAIEKFLSVKKYIAVHLEVFDKLTREKGKPGIVHVHVAMKAGLVAKKIKQQYHIPYIITEHWTAYYKQAKPNIFEMGTFFLRGIKKVFKSASLVLPVSDHLGKCINDNLLPVSYKTIYNTVDTRYFFYTGTGTGKFRFVHASYMHYQKNPEGILKACEILSRKDLPFELLMIGAVNEKLQQQCQQMGLLNKYVFFEPAVPYEEVAIKMQSSSALLLFSRFENMPCVILEALCCGLPVISTGVGGITEVIDKTNGIVVQNENVDELAHAMEIMISNYHEYDRKEIALKARSMFSYDEIGRQVKRVYEEVLTADNALVSASVK